jgi:predicted amino acid racemase
MAEYPRITISEGKLQENATELCRLARDHGMSVFGVTKCAFGNPIVGKAMIAGGCAGLADSRIENLEKLRAAGIDAQLLLIRLPLMSQIKRIVKTADISLNSEIRTIRRISKVCGEMGKRHKVILMVEMGDIREGVKDQDVEDYVSQIVDLPNIDLYGMGMNLACFGCIKPTEEKLESFSAIVERVQAKFSLKLHLISGGNSANVPLLLSGNQVSKDCIVNSLRLGESILVGREATKGDRIPNTHNDVFHLEAEVVEFKKKPCVPDGEVCMNWSGETPNFENEEERIRAILAVGCLDVDFDGIISSDPHVRIEGGCSDIVVVSLPASVKGRKKYAVGDIMEFTVSRYHALVTAFGSMSMTFDAIA